MANPNELILVDGSSFLYRAYFAVKKSFTTKDGFPTGAIFVITRMLQNLLEQFEGNKIVLVFDAKGGSFRNQIYPDYKATRPPMPDELVKQIEMVHQVAKAMGFPLLSVPGVEADDVLGSYTKAALAKGMQVVICTGDKDLAQLVEPNVTLLDTMKNIRYDEATVLEKYGVKPEHIIDFLALKGDSSDNIPGMTGVGDKTACAVIQGLGGIYDIKAHVNEIAKLKFRGSATFGEKFLAQWPQIELSYRLATIKCDVPLPIAIEDLPLPQTDHDTLISLFERLEFFRFAAEQRAKKANFNKMVDTMRGKESATDGHDTPDASEAKLSKGAKNTDTDGTKSMSDQELVSAAILRPQAQRKFEPSYAERLELFQQHQQQTAGTDAEALKFSENFQDVFSYRDGFKLVTSSDTLRQMVRAIKQAGRFSLFLEESSHHTTDSLLLGVACCCGEHDAYYVPLKHNYLEAPEQLPQTQLLTALRPILVNPEIKKIMYDLKQGRLYLHFLGIDMQGYLEDPMLIAHLLDSSRNVSLANLANDFLQYMPLDVKNLVPDHANETSGIDVEIFKDYACEQAQVALRLYDHCLAELQKLPEGMDLLGHEMQVLDVLYSMEECGALVDGKQLQELTRTLQQELFVVQEKIYDAAGDKFNIASPKQLGRVLFDVLKLPYPKSSVKVDKKGGNVYSTSDEVLSELGEYEVVRNVQQYRMLAKLISTYADKLPFLISKRTGRVHTCFNLAGTVTGRLSSSDPNLQNIPARTVEGMKIRCAFVAPKGYKIVSADYSQIELRLIAHFSEDQNLINAFQHHQDIHRVTASEVLGKPLEEVTDTERKHAKATNFGLMYGMGPHGLARQTGMTHNEAKQYIERYFQKYPQIQSLMDKIITEARSNGYIRTLLHNRVFIKNIQSEGMSKRAAERAAINAPMQGSAADIIKKAMVEVAAYIKTLPANSVHMTLQVHDELVFEVKEDLVQEFCDHIKEILEQVVTLKVPLEVGIGVGDSWADAH